MHSTGGSSAALSTTLVYERLTACGMWKLPREHEITPCQPHLCVHAGPVDVAGHREVLFGRAVQMIVSANGHHKVPFVDLIIAGKVGWRVSMPAFWQGCLNLASAWGTHAGSCLKLTGSCLMTLHDLYRSSPAADRHVDVPCLVVISGLVMLHCLPKSQMTVYASCLQEKDQNRVKGMRIMLERQTRAAAAAASAGSETAAKAAAEAQLVPPLASGASLAEPAPAVNGGTGPATAFAGAHPRLLICLPQ